jgi:hypothetical protein
MRRATPLSKRHKKASEARGSDVAEVHMPTINATIIGASRGATMQWDSHHVVLTNLGGGNFATQFATAAGDHIYRINVSGAPLDPWTADVSDGTTTQHHSGVVSPGGGDGTGDTGFRAQ